MPLASNTVNLCPSRILAKVFTALGIIKEKESEHSFTLFSFDQRANKKIGNEYSRLGLDF